MKLSDITIFKPYSRPYIVERNPSALTISLLSSIIRSPYFLEELKNIRENNPISPNGRPASSLKITDEPSLYEFIEWELKYPLNYFGLPMSFKKSFYLLIVFNSFIDIDKVNYPDIVYLENVAEISEATNEAEERLEPFSAITFGHKITKQQAHKWIDNNWNDINESMDRSLPAFTFENGKFTNIELSDEILNLSLSGKSTEEISEILFKKYPNNENVLDDGWIKNKLSRYKILIDRNTEKLSDLRPPEE